MVWINVNGFTCRSVVGLASRKRSGNGSDWLFRVVSNLNQQFEFFKFSSLCAFEYEARVRFLGKLFTPGTFCWNSVTNDSSFGLFISWTWTSQDNVSRDLVPVNQFLPSGGRNRNQNKRICLFGCWSKQNEFLKSHFILKWKIHRLPSLLFQAAKFKK